MSSTDYCTDASTSQVQTEQRAELSPLDRYYTAWAIVGELIAAAMTSGPAKVLGKRLALLFSAGWLPGKGDARFIAAMTNRPECSIDDINSAEPRTKHKVGRQVFYHLAGYATAKDAE